MAESPAKQEEAGPRERSLPTQGCPGHRVSGRGREVQVGIMYLRPPLLPYCSLGGEARGADGRGNPGPYRLGAIL